MEDWQYICKKRVKINEPCWFYNTSGCKNKDGSEKKDHECKYMHVKSNNVRKPVFQKRYDFSWPSQTNELPEYSPTVPHIVNITSGIKNSIIDLKNHIKRLETKIDDLIK